MSPEVRQFDLEPPLSGACKESNVKRWIAAGLFALAAASVCDAQAQDLQDLVILGRTVDENGRALAGARVVGLHPHEAEDLAAPLHLARSDRDGQFRLVIPDFDVEGGSFPVPVAARFPGRVPVEEEADTYDALVRRSEGGKLELDLGELRLEPGISFTSKIVDAAGKPLRAKVRVGSGEGDSSVAWMPIECEPDGTFEWSAAAGGRWTVVVHAPGMAVRLRRFESADDLAVGDRFEFEPIALAPERVVPFRITDSAGTAVPISRVTVEWSDRREWLEANSKERWTAIYNDSGRGATTLQVLMPEKIAAGVPGIPPSGFLRLQCFQDGPYIERSPIYDVSELSQIHFKPAGIVHRLEMIVLDHKRRPFEGFLYFMVNGPESPDDGVSDVAIPDAGVKGGRCTYTLLTPGRTTIRATCDEPRLESNLFEFDGVKAPPRIVFMLDPPDW